MSAWCGPLRRGEVVVGWGAGMIVGRYLALTLPFVLLLAALIFLGGLARGAPLWVVFVGPAAAAGFLLFLAYFEATSMPREVRVSEDGIVLSYGWPDKFEMSGAWKDWKPMAGSRIMGWVSLKYMNGPLWYPMTPLQARAIIEHPSCPEWELPIGVQRAVGGPGRRGRERDRRGRHR